MIVIDKEKQSAAELTEIFIQQVEERAQKDFDKFLADLEDRLFLAIPEIRLKVIREWLESYKKWWHDHKARAHYSGEDINLYNWWIYDISDWKKGERPQFSFFNEVFWVGHYQGRRRMILHLQKLLIEEQEKTIVQVPTEKEAATTLSNAVTFEALFLNEEGEKLALDLAKELAIPAFVEKEKQTGYVRYKSVFAALWLFLMHQRPTIVSDTSEQKACEAIAAKFGTTVRVNFWSNGASTRQQTKVFYNKLAAIMRKRGN